MKNSQKGSVMIAASVIVLIIIVGFYIYAQNGGKTSQPSLSTSVEIPVTKVSSNPNISNVSSEQIYYFKKGITKIGDIDLSSIKGLESFDELVLAVSSSSQYAMTFRFVPVPIGSETVAILYYISGDTAQKIIMEDASGINLSFIHNLNINSFHGLTDPFRLTNTNYTPVFIGTNGYAYVFNGRYTNTVDVLNGTKVVGKISNMQEMPAMYNDATGTYIVDGIDTGGADGAPKGISQATFYKVNL